MYARVITGNIIPGTQEQAAKAWEERVGPLLRNAPGFSHAMSLSDPQSNTVMTITFWRTQADAAAVETSGLYQQSLAHVAEFVVGTPQVTMYEVVVQI